MPKNTFILVTSLAIVAALLVGFNLGKKFNPTSSIVPNPTVIPTITPTAIPTLTYTDTYCKISLSYPSDMQVTNLATGSAKFISATNGAVVLACQKDIPGIAVPDDQKETIAIGSNSGTLYHTATPKDGTPIDVLKIRHPKTGMDILVSGVGSSFTTIVKSLTFTQ